MALSTAILYLHGDRRFIGLHIRGLPGVHLKLYSACRCSGLQIYEK